MSRRLIIRFIQVAFVIVSLAKDTDAHAQVGIGASFGYTHLSYPNLQDIKNDVFGIPGTQEWGQPGIRLGYLAPSGHWDLNVDFGLLHRSGTIGSDQTAVELLPQAQANTSVRSGLSLFANGGMGIVHESAPISSSRSITATRAVFGVGIGVRKSVSDGHGFVRAELRFDHVFEQVKELSPTSTLIFPATNLFSLKLGFDLLMVRLTRPSQGIDG